MNPLKHFLQHYIDAGLLTSTIVAATAGVIAGVILGVAVGLWLGKSIGYQPNWWKFLLAAGLVGGGGAIGFVGWRDWELDQPAPEVAETSQDSAVMQKSLLTGAALASAVLFCLAAGYRAGHALAVDEARRAYQAGLAAEQAAVRKKAEEDAARQAENERQRLLTEQEARRRAEEAARQAEIERQRLLAEEESRRRTEEEAARQTAMEHQRLLADEEARRRAEEAGRAAETERRSREQTEIEAAVARKLVDDHAEQDRTWRELRTEQRRLELAEKRREAEAWVKGYTATAVATVLGTSWLVGSSTAILVTLEATMCYHIGKIYNASWTMQEAVTAASGIGVAAFLGKLVAMEAMTFLPIVGWAAKSGIAAGVVWSMGQLVIQHFENHG